MAAPLPSLVAGTGPGLVILPGFALRPSTYAHTVTRLGDRWRMVVPNLFEVDDGWRYERVLDHLAATVDEHVAEPVTVLAHSFGGSIGLGFAARRPERVTQLVFADSVAVSLRWRHAANVFSGADFLRLATARAAVDFFHTMFSHPRRVAQAGWHSFITEKTSEIHAVRDSGIPVHVLWAERDTLVGKDHGRRFAHQLHADFRVVTDPLGRGPVDHDWVYRHPRLVEAALERLRTQGMPVRRGAARR